MKKQILTSILLTGLFTFCFLSPSMGSNSQKNYTLQYNALLQRTLTGIITDCVTGDPIPGASIQAGEETYILRQI